MTQYKYSKLKEVPQYIIDIMLKRQEEQGNKRDISVFERCINSNKYEKGFNWKETPEGYNKWYQIIENKRYSLIDAPLYNKGLSDFQSKINSAGYTPEEELSHLIDTYLSSDDKIKKIGKLMALCSLLANDIGYSLGEIGELFIKNLKQK